jgi:hypothetical protein
MRRLCVLCTTTGVSQNLIGPIESQGIVPFQHCVSLSGLLNLFVDVFSLLLVERGGGDVGVARRYFLNFKGTVLRDRFRKC